MSEDDMDLNNTEYPKCPYCGFIDQDWYDDNWDPHDGDITTYSCGNCGMEFEVEFHLYYDFTSWLSKKCPDCDGEDKRFEPERCKTCHGCGKVSMNDEEIKQERIRFRGKEEKN